MVNEDDGREDLFCTAGNISAFATAYSHGRYRLLNLKKQNKTKQNKTKQNKKSKNKNKKAKKGLDIWILSAIKTVSEKLVE